MQVFGESGNILNLCFDLVSHLVSTAFKGAKEKFGFLGVI
jgi:hypothetical protein